MRIVKVLIAVILVVSLLATPPAQLASLSAVAAQGEGGAALGKVEPLLLEELERAGQADFFIWLAEKADLTPAGALATRAEKGQYVYDVLRETADRTQAGLRRILDAQGADYQAFYIANKILIRGGGPALLTAIAERADVRSITANHAIQLEEPSVDLATALPAAVEASITYIRAPQVWALGYNGDGLVLADNSTGLDWDHPAIIGHYRGWSGVSANHHYDWWDATDPQAYPLAPGDGHGFGTFVSGIMVGDDGGANQIGVAPGAQLIACKNMTDGGSGTDATFTECFQWDLAPWDLTGANALPSMAPDVVNNSWGYYGGGTRVFEDEIAALQAAGIVVVAGAGNEGPACATLRSPADYGALLTVGSVDQSAPYPGTMTGYSSRGPSDLYGRQSLDVVAPGANIRSAIPGGTYEGGWSGTSMSAPHVAGLVALIWDACPSLRGLVGQTTSIIHESASPLTGAAGACGGDYVTGPNNDWGYGTIDALAAVNLARAQCGTACVLLVDDDNNAPDTRPYFSGALYDLGINSAVFVTAFNGGNGPDLGTLMRYGQVFWFSGDAYGSMASPGAGPNAADEALLAAYLRNGGRLFLSSQDYLYDRGVTAFGREYLGVDSFVNDAGDAGSVTGVTDDPIGDALGPYALTYPAGFADYGDSLTPAATARFSLVASGTARVVATDRDGGTWRTVFFGTDWVPVYNNNYANGVTILRRISEWLGSCSPPTWDVYVPQVIR